MRAALLLAAALRGFGLPASAQADLERPFDLREVRLSESERAALAGEAYRREGHGYVGRDGVPLSRSEAMAFLRAQSAKRAEDLLRRAERGEITAADIREMSHLYYARRLFLTKGQYESLRRWIEKLLPEKEDNAAKKPGAPGLKEGSAPGEAGEGGEAGPAAAIVSGGGGGSGRARGGGPSGQTEVLAGPSDPPGPAPPPAPSTGEASPAETPELPAAEAAPEELLAGVLARRPGAELTHPKGAAEFPDFLAGRMPALRRAGLRLLFFELGRGQDQSAFERLRRARDLKGAAAYIRERWGLPEPAAMRYAAMVRSAWAAGVRVVPLDEPGSSRSAAGEAALRSAVREGLRAQGPGARYLALSAEKGSWARALGIPSVEFSFGPAPSVRAVPGGYEIRLPDGGR